MWIAFENQDIWYSLLLIFDESDHYKLYRIVLDMNGQDHVDNQDGLFVMANSHSHDPVDYRKAPQNKCPLALEDALEAIRFLKNQGYSEQNIVSF